MEVDAGSLENALEEAFLKVAQQKSPKLPITSTIESWLNEQEDVVRRAESKGSQSATASHVAWIHHCSCRKEIAQLQSENQAININQETRFSFVTIGRTFAHCPYPTKDPPAGSAYSTSDAGTEVFLLAPTTDSTAEEKKKGRTKLQERVFESKKLSMFWKPGRKKILTEKRYTDPTIVPQVTLTQSFLGAAGASGAAQINPILAIGGGIEAILNAVRSKLKAIAKQRKYNVNPLRWAIFKR